MEEKMKESMEKKCESMKKELVVLWLDNSREPEVWLGKKLQSATHRHTLAFFNEKVYPYYTPRFVWVKNMREFQEYVLSHDLPGLVCFDHDLQQHPGDGEPSGRVVAQWLVDYCKEKGLALPMCWVQSGNPSGAPRIRKLLGLEEPQD